MNSEDAYLLTGAVLCSFEHYGTGMMLIGLSILFSIVSIIKR